MSEKADLLWCVFSHHTEWSTVPMWLIWCPWLLHLSAPLHHHLCSCFTPSHHVFNNCLFLHVCPRGSWLNSVNSADLSLQSASFFTALITTSFSQYTFFPLGERRMKRKRDGSCLCMVIWRRSTREWKSSVCSEGEYSECLDAEGCRTFWQPHTVILHKYRKSVGEDDLQAQRETAAGFLQVSNIQIAVGFNSCLEDCNTVLFYSSSSRGWGLDHGSTFTYDLDVKGLSPNLRNSNTSTWMSDVVCCWKVK